MNKINIFQMKLLTFRKQFKLKMKMTFMQIGTDFILIEKKNFLKMIKLSLISISIIIFMNMEFQMLKKIIEKE